MIFQSCAHDVVTTDRSIRTMLIYVYAKALYKIKQNNFATFNHVGSVCFKSLNIPSLGARDVLVVSAKQQVGLRNVGRQLSIIGYKHGEQLHRMKEHMFIAQCTYIGCGIKRCIYNCKPRKLTNVSFIGFGGQ